MSGVISPESATSASAADRLNALEQKVASLKPSDKDRWDKIEKLSTGAWAVVTLFVSIFVTGRIENALKERQLYLENIKDMQALVDQLNKADPLTAMSCAVSLGAHGRYSVVPLIQALQAGVPDHRKAAEAGLSAAAAVDHDFVCQQLTGVIGNRTGLYQKEVPESAARLLGDLNCPGALDSLQAYLARLDRVTPETAPFAKIPGTQGLTTANIEQVKHTARVAVEALRGAARGQ